MNNLLIEWSALEREIELQSDEVARDRLIAIQHRLEMQCAASADLPTLATIAARREFGSPRINQAIMRMAEENIAAATRSLKVSPDG